MFCARTRVGLHPIERCGLWSVVVRICPARIALEDPTAAVGRFGRRQRYATNVGFWRLRHENLSTSERQKPGRYNKIVRVYSISRLGTLIRLMNYSAFRGPSMVLN